jgi:hypothetical protein
MYAAIQLVGYMVVGCETGLMPLAVAVPISPAAAPAPTAALPSTAPATAPLFRPVAALAVDRPVPPGFERDCRGLTTAGADDGRPRAHAGSARTIAALVLGMGWSVAAAARVLFSLATRFAAPGRGVPAFLEKLLFTRSEHKFLTAVATSE